MAHLGGKAAELAGIAERARTRKLTSEEMQGGNFTISNLGNYGVEIFTPVINLPQTAILGVCTILPRPKDLGDGLFAFAGRADLLDQPADLPCPVQGVVADLSADPGERPVEDVRLGG